MSTVTNVNELPELLQERRLVNRLRQAVQFCKEQTSLSHFYTDVKMTPVNRLAMEQCLVKNYLLKHGNDYFGKRDMIYIDMQGDQDVARLYNTKPTPCVKAPAAEGADDGEDAGDDDEE